MSDRELEGRAQRLGYALTRWAEGRMPSDLVPAVTAEMRIVARALEEQSQQRIAERLRDATRGCP